MPQAKEAMLHTMEQNKQKRETARETLCDICDYSNTIVFYSNREAFGQSETSLKHISVTKLEFNMLLTETMKLLGEQFLK